MPHKASQSNLKQLTEAILQNPGRQAGFFARRLEWSREKVSRALVSLNDQGVLLSEDERGGLWPFGQRRT